MLHLHFEKALCLKRTSDDSGIAEHVSTTPKEIDAEPIILVAEKYKSSPPRLQRTSSSMELTITTPQLLDSDLELEPDTADEKAVSGDGIDHTESI